MQRVQAFTCAVIALISSAAVAQDAAPDYRVTKSVSLGEPDRWDAVVFDAAQQRVYVAHGDRVTVVDGNSGDVIGTVGTFPGGTHSVGIAAALHRGYTDDGRGGTAQSFDLATLKPEKTLKADADADGIVVDPATNHVFVINGDPGTITVIDPKRDEVIATITAGAKLEFAVAGGDGKIYVNGEAQKDIVRVDVKTNKVDAHWPMPGCTSPHGIAFDAKAHRLFATCANAVMTVVNSDTGAVVATVPIGQGTDGAGFDPTRKLAFSSNGRDGSLSVIAEKDPNTFVPVATIKTQVTGRTMDINPKTGRIFIPAAEVDLNAPGGGRPRMTPGSLKLLFLDPAP